MRLPQRLDVQGRFLFIRTRPTGRMQGPLAATSPSRNFCSMIFSGQTAVLQFLPKPHSRSLRSSKSAGWQPGLFCVIRLPKTWSVLRENLHCGFLGRLQEADDRGRQHRPPDVRVSLHGLPYGGLAGRLARTHLTAHTRFAHRGIPLDDRPADRARSCPSAPADHR